MEEYLEFAKEIADESAQIALKYFGFDTEKTWKSDDTPLTKADTEINSLVISKVNAKYPEHSVVGEEESNKKEGSKYAWVCDPIDGTIPFSCGLPIFTFSLALVDQSDGQPILGIINEPIMKNMYFAYKGGGAYRNDQKIFVTRDKQLKNTCLVVDSSRMEKIGFSNIRTMENLQKQGAKFLKLSSVAYGAVQVANGKFSGTIFFGPYAHDVAALKIITEEAGGKVTDLYGKERRYDKDGYGCVISNGVLHEEILKAVSAE